MRHSIVRGSIGLGVALAWLVLQPSAAKAFTVDMCPDACELVGIGILLSPPATFIVAQIAHGAQLRWFPIGWAVPELIYGGTATALLSIVMVHATEPFVVAPLVGISAWFTLHAVLSLAIGDRGPRRDARERRTSGQTRIVAAPLEGGAWAGIAGDL
jgi:hypothetical protein